MGSVEGLSQKGKKEKTHGQGQQCGDCWEEVEWREVEVGIGVKMVTDGDLTWGHEHRIRCTDAV